MGKFERILIADKNTFRILEESTPFIMELLKTSKIAKTSQALFMLTGKIMVIKNSILDLRETENLYAINILFRSLVEHHLRFMYVFMKSMEAKDDSVGVEFLETLLLKEQFDLCKSYAKVAKILGKDVQASWDDLKNMNLNPKNFSKRDVEEKSSEFTYSKIIAYIDERLNKSKEFDANFLLKIIPEYADLSSFVHGGPLSDKLMASLKSGEEVIEKIQNRVDLAFMTFHAAVQMAFLVFYQHDRRFEKPYLELKILMDALSKANAKDHEQSKS